MNAKPGRDVFLSYACEEDDPFLARLYGDLDEAGFSVWWDRVAMPSRGRAFIAEIREAIEECDRLVVVLGPRALESDYVRAEWQHALAEALAVVPLLRKSAPDDVPAELSVFRWLDFREEASYASALSELTQTLRAPLGRLGRWHGRVSSSPQHFRPRVDDTNRLADTVLRGLREPVAVNGPERMVVLHGMAGAGKTVLAAEFARSTRARRSFPDGILWARAGRDEPLEIVRRVGALLGDAEYPDLPEGTSRLRESLAGGRTLLVLDNCWRADQLTPILDALDTNTRVLATARGSELATATGARGVALGELSEKESLRHLADWAGLDVADLPVEATDLAKECGYLAFALALNGAMLAGGSSWSVLVRALRSARIEHAEHPLGAYEHPSVLRAIQVSLDALEASDPDAARRYRELAAFRWDGGVPEAALATFWSHRAGLDELDAAKLLTQLAGKALVRTTRGPDGERWASLHDLHRRYLERTAGAREGDGEGLDGLSAALLEAYRRECPGDWPGGPSDGYFHEHLVEHLARADDPSEVHRLLALEDHDAEGRPRNAWLAARTRAGDAERFLRDVRRARSLAEQGRVSQKPIHGLLRRGNGRLRFPVSYIFNRLQRLKMAVLPWTASGVASCDTLRGAEGEDAGQTNVGLEVRYALMQSSLFSQAANVPPQLLRELVAIGELGEREALELALRCPRPADRWDRIRALVPALSTDELRRLASDVESRGPGPRRAETQLAIAERCEGAEAEELVEQALDSISQVDDVLERGVLIRMAAEHVAGERLGALVNELLALPRFDRDPRRSPDPRQTALRVLVPLLPAIGDESLEEEFLARIRSLGWTGAEHFADLVELHAVASAGRRPQVFDVARETALDLRGEQKVRALSQLVAIAPPELRTDALEEVERALREWLEQTDSDWKIRGIAGFADVVPAELREGVVEEIGRAVDRFDDAESRARVWPEAAPLLVERHTDEFWERVVGETRSLSWSEERTRRLAKLCPALPPALRDELLLEVLTLAREIERPETRLDVLGPLASATSGPLSHDAWIEALNAAVALPEWRHWIDVVPRVVEEVPEEVAALFFEDARRAPAGEAQTLLLTFLALRLPAAQRDDALREVYRASQAIGDPEQQVPVLVWLYGSPAGSLGAEEFDGSSDGPFDERERRALLDHALEAAHHIGRPKQRGEALASLVPFLNEPRASSVAADVLAAVREIDSVNCRPYFPGQARGIVLEKLAPHCPDDQRAALLALVREPDVLYDSYWRSRVLQAVLKGRASSDREALAREAIDEASDVGRIQRAEALASLAAYLEGDERAALARRAVDLALGETRTNWRPCVLGSVLSKLPEPDREPWIPVLREDIEKMTAPKDRIDALTWLAGVTAGDVRARAVEEGIRIVLELEDPKIRVAACACLLEHAPAHLADELVTTIVLGIEEIDNLAGRAWAIGALPVEKIGPHASRLYPPIRAVLRGLSDSARPVLLSSLVELLAALSELGGPAHRAEVAMATWESLCWWSRGS